MSFYYLATVYSKHAKGIGVAFREACEQAALLVRAGVPVFSPICMTHPITVHGDIDPYDHKIWLEADRTFMEAARGLIVCKMPGWEESYGIGEEIKTFQRLGKPIVYINPGSVPYEVLPNRRPVIALCGHAFSGKDSAAKPLLNNGWRRVAFATPLRSALLRLNPIVDEFDTAHSLVTRVGWDDAKKLPEVRRLLQRLGTEAGRDIHGQDCWVKLAAKAIDAADCPVVITDLRFPEELPLVRYYGGKVIWIERPGVGPVNGHKSDNLAWLKDKADHVIVNDGTIEELHAKIREVANACNHPRQALATAGSAEPG